jgi:hypothetical protein
MKEQTNQSKVDDFLITYNPISSLEDQPNLMVDGTHS